MPMYEYECVEDGEILTLLRPMADADAPVEDPEAQGRTFRRRYSVFGVATNAATAPDPNAPPMPGVGCGCGKAAGHCRHH